MALDRALVRARPREKKPAITEPPPLTAQLRDPFEPVAAPLKKPESRRPVEGVALRVWHPRLTGLVGVR